MSSRNSGGRKIEYTIEPTKGKITDAPVALATSTGSVSRRLASR
jgi:hypothetical protein